MSKVVKYIINPEYLASAEYRQDIECAKDALAQAGHAVEDFFPQDYGKKLPDDGAWIILLCSLDLGKPLPDGECEKIHVPHLSMWFATPTATNHSISVNLGRRNGRFEVCGALATIQTPQGPVNVWPREYVIVKDLSRYLEFTEEDGLYIHFLHPGSSGFDELKMFYLRSRGISKAQAQRWLLPELKNPYFCYFTFNEEYCKIFGEGFGMPYLRGR